MDNFEARNLIGDVSIEIYKVISQLYAAGYEEEADKIRYHAEQINDIKKNLINKM